MNGYISTPSSAHPREGTYISHDQAEVDIESVFARSILDSRGWPTVEVSLALLDGTTVTGAAPAGASTGAHEAVELRDGGTVAGGRGVQTALARIRDDIAPMLARHVWTSQATLDAALRELDGTENLSRLGANSVVAVSIAAARAFAAAGDLPLWEWIAREAGTTPSLPVPHFNVLNGGAHAPNRLDFQEFMIAPVGATTEFEAVSTGADVYHALQSLVKKRYGAVGLGDEGGFAPELADPREALDLLIEAIESAGHSPALDDVAIALDPAANGFYAGQGVYRVAGDELGRDDLGDLYASLLGNYPIRSIEDGFAEDDLDGWRAGFQALGDRVQIVGDDLYVTSPERIREGARQFADAALIKPNQNGTVTGTLKAMAAARQSDQATMISHRSGETADDFIADLAVGTGAGQIKSGAPARGERVAKYNRLTGIEAESRGTLSLTRLG